MNIHEKNITFIIVTYKSHNVIEDCLKTIPYFSKKIIIENSNDFFLKKKLENKFNNIEVILSKNNGYSVSNNIGLKMTDTEFAYILNPDARFRKNTFLNLIKDLKKLDNFAIVSPISSNIEKPNYYKNQIEHEDKNFLSVNFIDGFSMLINMNKFKDNIFFDENFFMFLEATDLCKRKKDQGEKLYIVKSSIIDHLHETSVDNQFKNEIEILRNWHWMWSKVYFNKKYNGQIKTLFATLPSLIRTTLKFITCLFLMKNKKAKIYKSRMSGIFNGLLGADSWYRIKIEN